MSTFKVGDKVIVKNNSHYSKPTKIVRILQSRGSIYYCLQGALQAGTRRFLHFTEDELIDKEVWNSPLFKAMSED